MTSQSGRGKEKSKKLPQDMSTFPIVMPSQSDWFKIAHGYHIGAYTE
jgi:hypothetical protein